jgi:HEAT repeat protein
VIRALLPLVLLAAGSSALAQTLEVPAATNPNAPPSAALLADLRPKVIALLGATDGAAERWKILGPEALTVLRQLASDPAETAGRRAAATLSIAYVDNPSATEILRSYATDANVLPQVRQSAVHALAAREGTNALPALTPLLADGDADVRLSTAKAIGDVGGPAARTALQARLATESSPQVRDEIQKALARSAN